MSGILDPCACVSNSTHISACYMILKMKTVKIGKLQAQEASTEPLCATCLIVIIKCIALVPEKRPLGVQFVLTPCVYFAEWRNSYNPYKEIHDQSSAMPEADGKFHYFFFHTCTVFRVQPRKSVVRLIDLLEMTLIGWLVRKTSAQSNPWLWPFLSISILFFFCSRT